MSQEHFDMVEEIDQEHADCLTNWEIDFVENMMRKTKRIDAPFLTQGQRVHIEKLYEKYCE